MSASAGLRRGITPLEGEVEVEVDLNPPFDSVTDREITVRLEPAAWFTRLDGTVWDLSAMQDQLVEFEFELEHGFEAQIQK